MLLLGIITLVMTIPLASLYLSTILIHRFILLIFLFIIFLLVCSVGVLGGLFQITILSQSLEILILGDIILLLVPEGKGIIFSSQGAEEFYILLFTSSFEDFNIFSLLFNLFYYVFVWAGFCTDMLKVSFCQRDFVEAFDISMLLTSTVPIKVYLNAEHNKKRVILENKNKSGVYQFINLLTGNSYVGSSTNLSRRFGQYFNYNYISSPVKRRSIINSSLLKNGYSNFSEIILEYCEIKDTLNQEQFYIDVIGPTMNILKIAGNCLGYKHSEESPAEGGGPRPRCRSLPPP